MLAACLACTCGDQPEKRKGKAGKHRKDKTSQDAGEGKTAGDGAAKPGDGNTTPDPKQPAAGKTAGTAPKGITDLGNQTWSVKRKLAQKWKNNPEKFANATQKGKGWALKGVRKRDAQWVGFDNGDVIQSVNGRKLGSAAEAAAAYSALQDAKTLKVKFKRDGQARTNVIKIVD
jgi:type II secretory pathway component PulC